jgi:hypothetical protein
MRGRTKEGAIRVEIISPRDSSSKMPEWEYSIQGHLFAFGSLS